MTMPDHTGEAAKIAGMSLEEIQGLARFSPESCDRIVAILFKAATPDKEREGSGDIRILIDCYASAYHQWNKPGRGPLQKEVDREALRKARADLDLALSALSKARSAGNQDGARMDWLERQHVIVRTPLAFGSAGNFQSSPEDIDGETGPSDLRAEIDRALKHSPKAGQGDPDIQRMMKGDLR